MGEMVAGGPVGRIVVLNGTSSSGKTSIARELLELLDEPYFHLAVDAFGAMRSASRTDALSPDEVARVLRATRAGFHRAVAGMAAAGNNVVVDYVLSEAWRWDDCLTVWAGFEVVLVGVFCPPAELRRREEARGDRAVGQAEAQLSTVHSHHMYDVEVDTSGASPRDCALTIVEYLADPEPFGSFERLSRALAVQRAATAAADKAAALAAESRTERPGYLLAGPDWRRLHHAYGEASGLPVVLAGLLSEDAALAEQALGALDAAVLHQGTIYSVTAPVAQYVARVVGDPRTMLMCGSGLPWDEERKPVRARLLSWLGEVGASARVDREDPEDPDVARCQAIRPELATAVAPFLDDEIEAVRTAARDAADALG